MQSFNYDNDQNLQGKVEILGLLLYRFIHSFNIRPVQSMCYINYNFPAVITP